ncbi:MAG: FMN-binding protein [Campylobacterales bacterium]|nr:FMN-binding protein [Campylobacterales bacterium]
MKYLILLFVGISYLSSHATFSTTKVVQPHEAMAYYFTHEDTEIYKKNIILSKSQHQKAQQRIKTKIKSKLQRFYIAELDGKILGYGGLITTNVRTKGATILVVMDAEGKTKAVEVLAFFEPMSYYPTEKWLNSFNEKTIKDDLVLRDTVPVITGATLTSETLIKATKTMLAVWEEYFNKGN